MTRRSHPAAISSPASAPTGTAASTRTKRKNQSKQNANQNQQRKVRLWTPPNPRPRLRQRRLPSQPSLRKMNHAETSRQANAGGGTHASSLMMELPLPRQRNQRTTRGKEMGRGGPPRLLHDRTALGSNAGSSRRLGDASSRTHARTCTLVLATSPQLKPPMPNKKEPQHKHKVRGVGHPLPPLSTLCQLF